MKEIQNKTQPIPKKLLEMAKAETGLNFSTGTSIICNRVRDTPTNKSKTKTCSKSKRTEDCKPKVGKR